MVFDPIKHHGSSTRLKGFDYSQAGMYFATICTEGRNCLLGKIENDVMVLNDAGRAITQAWYDLATRFHFVELDEFVAMPNHVHGIIFLRDDGDHRFKGDHEDRPYNILKDRSGTTTKDSDICNRRGESHIRPCGPADRSIGRIIEAFKSLTTRDYSRGVNNHGWKTFETRLWQRNYHDHIVRNDRELMNIRQYIFNNPSQWGDDRENPDAIIISTKNPWEA